MNSDRILLILDDEREWLNRHKRYFQKHGYICIPIFFAKDAIDLFKGLKTIKYAIIDEILFDPTQPDKDVPVTQDHSGKGVILEILEHRSDIKFVIITRAISQLNTGKEQKEFKRDLNGLNNIYYACKDEFDIDPDETYDCIRNDFFERVDKTKQRKSRTNNLKKKKEERIKVLILVASPDDLQPLNPNREVQEIEDGWKLAKNRDQFEFVVKRATGIDDLRRTLLDESPKIVHFCGHGLGREGLAFEDESGQTYPVSTDALSKLFKHLANKIECVFLNACHTELQAKEIAKHINFAIGIRGEIGQEAARQFAVGFYDALVRGKPIEASFDFGLVAMSLENSFETDHPILLRKGDQV